MMDKKIIRVSPLGKTWLFDIDGTICKHNGYKTDGHDTLLPGAKDFFDQVAEGDKVVLLTSRDEKYAVNTERFLSENGIKFDAIIYGLPYGERILINDKKPSGLVTGLAINTERDVFLDTEFVIDPNL